MAIKVSKKLRWAHFRVFQQNRQQQTVRVAAQLPGSGHSGWTPSPALCNSPLHHNSEVGQVHCVTCGQSVASRVAF
jgi:hypothetical protein